MSMIFTFFKDIHFFFGPMNWIYFGCVFVVVCGMTLLFRRLDKSRKLPPLEPPEGELDMIEFATLRHGPNELVRLYLFELIADGYLELTRDESGKVTRYSELRRTDKPLEAETIRPELLAFLDYFDRNRMPKDVFIFSPLKSYAKKQVEQYQKSFQNNLLIYSQNEVFAQWAIFIAGLFFLLGVGVAECIVTFATQHKDIFFPNMISLAMSMFLTLFLFLLFLTPDKITRRGRQYIKAVQKKFYPETKTIKNEITSGMTTLDLLFPVAVLGVPILAGSSFEEFAKQFNRGTMDKGGEGGCGGGCGGCGGCGGD